MIGFCINGRLGNQMFQLAAAYALARKHSALILPDERTGRYDIPDIFDTGLKHPVIWKFIHDFIETSPKKIKFRLRKYLYPFVYKLYPLQFRDAGNYMALFSGFENLENDICLNGYFQSEKYFQSCAAEIKAMFTFKSVHTDYWQKYFHTLPQHSRLIAVHIRQSDYRNLGHLNLGGDDLTLPLEYYIRLIDQERKPGTLFIVMSDEPEMVRQALGDTQDIIISSESVATDLITLTRAEVCILSHSTFSWWGAWLNGRTDRKVYVPEYFLGFKIQKETPECIIPEGWIQVSTETFSPSHKDLSGN